MLTMSCKPATTGPATLPATEDDAAITAEHAAKRFATPNRFPMVWCSSCGCGFGPGNFGYSHCKDHKGVKVVAD